MAYNILVVEDEIILADHLCETLSLLGYTYLEPAINYTEAIERLKEKPDLVILDVNLGGKLTGFDVAKHINENYQIPFIYLTAFSNDSAVEQASTTFPAGYLIKPYRQAELRPAIEIAMANFNRKLEKGNDVIWISQWDLFTLKERTVLKLISQNHTSQQIGEYMCVSLSTIKSHRHNVCVKLGLSQTNNSLLSWVLLNKENLEAQIVD